jgi:hypothetical protein
VLPDEALPDDDELVEPLAVVPLAALLDDDELELLEPLPLEVELPVLPVDPAGLADVPEVAAPVAAGVAAASAVATELAAGSG